MSATALKDPLSSQPRAAPTSPSPLAPSEWLKKGESIQPHGRLGLHLFKDGYVRVFSNRTQAEAAAQRSGGIAYQSVLSNRFLVCYE